MKIKNFSRLLIFFALIACQRPADLSEGLEGVYAFYTLEGQYAEVWVGEEYLAINRAGQEPSVFPYLTQGDTVKLYDGVAGRQRQEVLHYFVILSRNDSVVEIEQDSVQNQFYLIIDKTPEVMPDSATRAYIEEEFVERLKEN